MLSLIQRLKRWIRITVSFSLLPLVAISPLALAPSASANPVACSATGAAQNGLRVTPSHGNAFYIDSGQNQNIDASFVGYRIYAESGAARKSGLWVSLENFNGGSVSLANPLDGQQVLNTFAGNDTQTAFFLLKATKPTTATQSHRVKIYSAPPSLATASELLYDCQYSFSRVRETIKASPNQVNSVTVGTIPALGETFTVTVEGNTGIVGAGGSPDFDAMWLSPAPRSTFPTRAMKLVGTKIVFSVSGGSSSASLTTFLDQLLISNLRTKLAAIKTNAKRANYTATYTFQIIGKTAAAVKLLPVAQIASGQQMKHTDLTTLNSLSTNADLTNVDFSKVTVAKTQDSATSTGTSSGDYIKVPYLVTVQNSGSSPVTIDKIQDIPSSGVLFDSTSTTTLRVFSTAASYTQTTILGSSTSASGTLTIPGPVTIGASRKAEIRYYMLIPKCGAGSQTFDNTARAYIGDAVVGSSTEGYVPKTTVTQTCGSNTITSNDGTEALPVEVQTYPATSVGDATATLNGLVDSNGNANQNIYFDYGTSPSALTSSIAPSNVDSTTSSTNPVAITKALTGLSTGTIYYFRARVGSVVGQTLSFVTTEPVGSVTLTTDSATSVSASNPFATLNGTIDPNGNTTYVSFSVSTTSDLSANVRTVMLSEDPSSDLQTNVAQESTYNDYLTVSGAYPQQISILFSDFTRTRSSPEETGIDITPTLNTTYYYRFNYHTSTNVGTIASSGSIKSFTVKTMTDQTISYPDIADRTFSPSVSDSFTLTVETSSANLTLTYSSEDTSVCTIDGFRVIILKAGTCIITASQPGNSSTNPATPVTKTFAINRASQSIALADSSVIVGSSITLAATGGSGTGALRYSSDVTRCSITGQTLTGNSVGLCQITAVKESDENFEEATTSAQVAVRNLPTAVTGDVASDSVTTTTAQLMGTFTPNVAEPDTTSVFVTYSSATNLDPPSSATISSATSGSGNSALNVVSSASGLTHGTRYYYRVRAVRGADEGLGAIKSFVTRPDTPTNVVVTPASNSASIAFTPVVAGSGVTISYTATCTPTSGGAALTATGSSSPITVGGLSSDTDYQCTVKANSSASGSGGGGFGGLGETTTVRTTAPKADRVIKIFGLTSSDRESQTVTIIYGETITAWAAFEASGTRATRTNANTGVGDGTLVFAAATGSNCSITQVGTSETATVAFTRIGVCTFNATIRENATYSETTTAITLSVNVVAKGLVATGSSHNLTFGDAVPTLSASVTGFAGDETTSTAAGYVAPSCTTNYTNPTNAGTSGLTVTCSSGAATNYTFSYVAGSITVNPANQVVTLAALAAMTVGDANQATSTTNDKSQAVTLAATPASVCELSGINVRAISAGTCTVTAQSSASTNYNASNVATRSFTVNAAATSGGGNSGGGGGGGGPTKLTPTITWNDPADIFNPTPLGSVQLNAVGSVPGSMVYSPALGTVLPVGRHTLAVTLNPTDANTYNSVSTTVRIRVLAQRFQTVLTWNNPASIVYPTPLGPTQLNARANTPGRFTYDPPAGTILDPGTHTLKVNFEPNLSRTFQNASTQVTITVLGSKNNEDPKNQDNKPTPERPFVVDTKTSVTPPGPNNDNKETPKAPVILVDTKSVSTVEITDRGPGVTNAELKTGKVEIQVAPTFSGKTNVEVTYVQNNETKVTVIPFVIPPSQPANAASTPQAMDRSTITWKASPNALSYDVFVREKLECQVRTTSCEVPFIVGPATPLRVVAIGGSETKSEIEPVFKQEKVIPALTVNFATASFRLSEAFKQELRDLAEVIAREGFTSLIVYGHTDSRSYDNRTLSRNRAQVTRDFLANLLPGVEFKVAGFAATQKVAAENSKAGLAQNRRAEVRIAP
ncbi:MAG: fibronectin type III domain-containing protein [Candidatus Nanopelagicaceae bacterium]